MISKDDIKQNITCFKRLSKSHPPITMVSNYESGSLLLE